MVKLRYIIAKFDIGTLAGGLQSSGVAKAKAKQLAEAHQVMKEATPGVFELKQARTQGRGRLSGVRVRLSQEATRGKQYNLQIAGGPASRAIEKAVGATRRWTLRSRE